MVALKEKKRAKLSEVKEQIGGKILGRRNPEKKEKRAKIFLKKKKKILACDFGNEKEACRDELLKMPEVFTNDEELLR